METMNNNNHPWNEMGPYPAKTPAPVKTSFGFPVGRKELVYALCALICGMLLCNFVIFGGFHLGFGIAMCGYILCAAGYLLASGGKLNAYSTILLVMSLGIAAGFGRSDDGFVKVVMVCFLTVSVNLGLCLIAGQNRHRTGSAGSLLDAGRTVFKMGYGDLSKAVGSLFRSLKTGGSSVKTVGAVLLGLLIMVPVMAIVISLLVKADAAFESVMNFLPEIKLEELLTTAIFGFFAFCVFYTRGVSLVNEFPKEDASTGKSRGLNKITMNTVLIGLCLVYGVYLLSQLAYFVSGFAGIVPEGYSMAEYARRGFFEMAWLCAINMGLTLLSVSLVCKSNGKAPLSTRLLCLFLGIVTLFMVAASSAKMLTYIGGYGLTRLRVMTQLIIVFFGLMAVTVSVGLFVEKPWYMPVLLIGALIIGGSAFWVDVDTVVATYNVNAYQNGVLSTVDVGYLGTLSSGAIPQIAKLVDDKNPAVARSARIILNCYSDDWEDFRSWNYATWRTKPYVDKHWDIELPAPVTGEYN